METTISRILPFLMLCTVIGCIQPSLKPEVVSRVNTQQTSEILYGEIINVKAVTIQADPKQGSLIGGAIGAVTGSMVSENNEKQEMLGALVGGVLGVTPSHQLFQIKSEAERGFSSLLKPKITGASPSLRKQANTHLKLAIR